MSTHKRILSFAILIVSNSLIKGFENFVIEYEPLCTSLFQRNTMNIYPENLSYLPCISPPVFHNNNYQTFVFFWEKQRYSLTLQSFKFSQPACALFASAALLKSKSWVEIFIKSFGSMLFRQPTIIIILLEINQYSDLIRLKANSLTSIQFLPVFKVFVRHNVPKSAKSQPVGDIGASFFLDFLTSPFRFYKKYFRFTRQVKLQVAVFVRDFSKYFLLIGKGDRLSCRQWLHQRVPPRLTYFCGYEIMVVAYLAKIHNFSMDVLDVTNGDEITRIDKTLAGQILITEPVGDSLKSVLRASQNYSSHIISSLVSSQFIRKLLVYCRSGKAGDNLLTTDFWVSPFTSNLWILILLLTMSCAALMRSSLTSIKLLIGQATKIPSNKRTCCIVMAFVGFQMVLCTPTQ